MKSIKYLWLLIITYIYWELTGLWVVLRALLVYLSTHKKGLLPMIWFSEKRTETWLSTHGGDLGTGNFIAFQLLEALEKITLALKEKKLLIDLFKSLQVVIVLKPKLDLVSADLMTFLFLFFF